jgi:hypothetical protein
MDTAYAGGDFTGTRPFTDDEPTGAVLNGSHEELHVRFAREHNGLQGTKLAPDIAQHVQSVLGILFFVALDQKNIGANGLDGYGGIAFQGLSGYAESECFCLFIIKQPKVV